MKKKVLIIVENLPVPFDSRVWKEACSLRANDYEVAVLCPKGKGYEEGYQCLEGIHIYRHPAPKEGNSPLGYLWEFGCALFWQFLFSWWIFLKRGFHIIQGCNPPDDIFLVALPFKLVGVKYIFDHHDANPELYVSKYDKRGLLYRIQVTLEKLTYRFSDVVMATNNSYRQLAIERGGLAPQDVFVVRNGPDLDAFRPVPAKIGLKYGKPFLVGYVGTMSTQEGLDILLDVALHLKNQGRRDIHFTCVGGGPGLGGLRRMVQDKGLQDTVNFTGRVSEQQLLDVLCTADVCVNPDKPCEMNDISTMIKIMEYMALSKPIVQFNLKEGRFSAQGASLYSDNRDQVSDFADKILWLLEHPDESLRMGEFGYRRVKMELAWEYSVGNLLAAYDRAFSKRAVNTQQDPYAEDMKSIERLLVGLDTRPWDIVYRVLIGVATLLIESRFVIERGIAHSDWVLVPLLVTVFLILRAVPVVVRKILPFSNSARGVWAQRRTMAKRYDSYQWQKLLGFGIGLALYTLISGQLSTARISISTFCLACGTVGTIMWRKTSEEIDTARKSAKLATVSRS